MTRLIVWRPGQRIQPTTRAWKFSKPGREKTAVNGVSKARSVAGIACSIMDYLPGVGSETSPMDRVSLGLGG